MSELEFGTSQGSTMTPRTTTFLDLLRGQIGGPDRVRRKRSLKERLRFKCISCCGLTSGPNLTNNTLHNHTEIDEQQTEIRFISTPDPSSGSGINLATALEAERHNNRRETPDAAGNMTPTRVSLMRLLEETAEKTVDVTMETERLTASMGNDSVCCVCLGRKKGAAFIPCGHTFCRVCSRELWLNRGSCPLCNRPIIEILDIF